MAKRKSPFATAADLAGRKSILVAGSPGTGKSRAVLNDLSDDEAVVWLNLTNLGGLENRPQTAVVSPTDYETFEREFLYPLTRGEEKGKWDAIVIDGLHILSQWCVHWATKSRGKKFPAQIDFGTMGVTMQNNIIRLKRATNRLYVTTDILPNDQDEDVLAVNRGLHNKIMSQFSEKWLCTSWQDKSERKRKWDVIKGSSAVLNSFKPRAFKKEDKAEGEEAK